MDGDWVEQTADLYLRRYYDPDGSADRSVLERVRITNCIRECLPHPSRIDAKIPVIMADVCRYREALERIQGNDPEANRQSADCIANAALRPS